MELEIIVALATMIYIAIFFWYKSHSMDEQVTFNIFINDKLICLAKNILAIFFT
jgi:hypothetical protein